MPRQSSYAKTHKLDSEESVRANFAVKSVALMLCLAIPCMAVPAKDDGGYNVV